MAGVRKIAVLGAGNIGGSLTQRLAEADLAEEIALIDIVDGLPQGKALDIQESAPILGFSARVSGSTSLDALAGSDIVIETAGLARKPGMSRSDLLEKNAAILRGHALAVRAEGTGGGRRRRHEPGRCDDLLLPGGLRLPRGAGVRGVRNPRHGPVPHVRRPRARNRPEGRHGVRARHPRRHHGPDPLPLLAWPGFPCPACFPPIGSQRIVERTKKGGGEIVDLLKTGSAYYAPSASQLELVRAVARNEHRVLPVTATLSGEFHQSGLCLGVPAMIGRRGVERVIEVDLSTEERSAFDASAAAVKADLAILARLPKAG